MRLLDYCKRLIEKAEHDESVMADDAADLLLDIHTACLTHGQNNDAEGVKAIYNAFVVKHKCGPPGPLLAAGDEKGAALLLQAIEFADSPPPGWASTT